MRKEEEQVVSSGEVPDAGAQHIEIALRSVGQAIGSECRTEPEKKMVAFRPRAVGLWGELI